MPSFPRDASDVSGSGKGTPKSRGCIFHQGTSHPRHASNFFLLFAEQRQPHPGPLQALQQAAINRRRQGVGPTTRKNYLASVRTFVQFMIVHELDPYRPSLNDVGAFLEFLITDHNSPATIQNYQSHVQMVGQAGHHPDVRLPWGPSNDERDSQHRAPPPRTNERLLRQNTCASSSGLVTLTENGSPPSWPFLWRISHTCEFQTWHPEQ